jgi:hypothetical protein
VIAPTFAAPRYAMRYSDLVREAIEIAVGERPARLGDDRGLVGEASGGFA